MKLILLSAYTSKYNYLEYEGNEENENRLKQITNIAKLYWYREQVFSIMEDNKEYKEISDKYRGITDSISDLIEVLLNKLEGVYIGDSFLVYIDDSNSFILTFTTYQSDKSKKAISVTHTSTIMDF